MDIKLVQSFLAVIFLLTQVLPTNAQGKNYSVETSAKADQYGFLQLIIQNKSLLKITAVTIVHSCDDPSRAGPNVFWTGFDSELSLLLGKWGNPDIAPGAHRAFDVASENAKCPGGISVVFSDGHCEGLQEGSRGCTELLADRRLAYAELAEIRSFAQKISDQDDQYITKMQTELESRRVAHSQDRQEKSFGRMQVLQQLKNEFPPYTTPPP